MTQLLVSLSTAIFSMYELTTIKAIFMKVQLTYLGINKPPEIWLYVVDYTVPGTVQRYTTNQKNKQHDVWIQSGKIDNLCGKTK